MERCENDEGAKVKTKKKKYNQTGVWACPDCWKEIEVSYFQNKKAGYVFNCCKHGFYSLNGLRHIGEVPLYFDSQAEYAHALKLKDMEKRGLIRDLIHHPRIELAPDIFFLQLSGRYTPIADPKTAKKYPDICVKVHDKLTYEADFQYTDDTGVHFVEVKVLSRKGVLFIHGIAKFRIKVELLKAVHGIDLEIVTGAIKWRFNGKKLEVVK